MSFDDPAKADVPYTMADVEEIERVRGKLYPRLRATVKALGTYARHLDRCSRTLPSALRPCSCGLLDLLGLVDKAELVKRKAHPEFGPFPTDKAPRRRRR